MLRQGKTKTKRKPNFTEEENIFLVEEYEKNKAILQSKLNNTEVNYQKAIIWQSVCNELNLRNPNVRRTPDEVRRKWKNMVTIARKDMMNLNPTRSPSMVNQRIMQGYSRDELERQVDRVEHTPATEHIKLEPLGAGVFGKAAAKTSPSTSPAENETGPKDAPNQIMPEIPIVSKSDNVISSSPLNSITVTQPAIPRASIRCLPMMPCPRSAEVSAAMACDMTVVQPGPPASVVATRRNPAVNRVQSPATAVVATLRSPVRAAVKPKRHRLTSLLQNAKKRRLESTLPSTPVMGFDLAQLQKEKLMLEKEKLVLEKEKLVLEKEKLALEIQCLRSQMQNDTASDSEEES